MVIMRDEPAWAAPPPDHRPPPWWRQLYLRFVEPGWEPRLPAKPFVEFFRVENVLWLDVCGPLELESTVHYSAQQKADLRALGYEDPRDRPKRVGPNNFRAFFPNDGDLSRLHPDACFASWKGRYEEVVDFQAAIGLAVDTLRGPLRVETPVQLCVARSAGWRHPRGRSR
ncbi:MAG: hypothetical protein ACT4QG_06865 [Sporichthyaceae bacterium]